MANLAERLAAAIQRHDQRIYERLERVVNAAFDAFDAEIEAEREHERINAEATARVQAIMDGRREQRGEEV